MYKPHTYVRGQIHDSYGKQPQASLHVGPFLIYYATKGRGAPTFCTYKKPYPLDLPSLWVLTTVLERSLEFALHC